MWIPEVGVFELIVRGVLVYLVLFVLLRFIGKKHVGELSPFDLVVLLIISETVDGSLIGEDHSLTGGLISAATSWMESRKFWCVMAKLGTRFWTRSK